VKLEVLTLPVKIRPGKKGLKVTCQRMELGDMDSSGRRRPVPVPGSEYTQEYDSVLAAIGQQPEIPGKLGVEVSRRQRIGVDELTLQTSVEGVFAGGDVVTGPASVVEAIAHGRLAAEAIDRYLGGSGEIGEKLAPEEDLSKLPPLSAETKARLRPKMPHRAPKARARTFQQVEMGYSREAAIMEAGRCLRCDLED